MRVLDLFSGIGGFSLGLRMAGGFETVQFCEIDPYCQKVLAKNFRGVPIHDDIRSFQPTPGSADLICGGFPCQPFSAAGKQAGKGDDRDLWPEMARVISAVRPTWVIGENVAGFVNMELDRSLSDLEALGYACQALVIPACATDAPHRRDRVWIVAHADHSADDRFTKGAQERFHNITRGGSFMAHGNSGDAQRGAQPGSYRPDRPKPNDQYAGGRRGNSGPASGGEAAWLPEPGVGRVAHGIPRRLDRLRGLGNAVVPQVVAEIGRAIRQAHNDKNPKPYIR